MVGSGSKNKYLRLVPVYVGVFAQTAAGLLVLLLLAAKIPTALIEEHVLASAEYLCEGELFGRVLDHVDGSKIDRYADSILLNIAYHYDAEKPFRSVMESAYYFTEYQNENENLLESIRARKEVNRQYLRYWHGSAAVVRGLLVLASLSQIYMWHGVLLGILTLVLLIILLKERAYAAAAGILAGEIMASCWFVPLSLEYTWMFLLMTVLAILVALFGKRWTVGGLGIFFLIAGMVTNYLDFLTTETITLTVPLLLYLWMQRDLSPKERTERTLWPVCSWTMGYVGMWVLKWGLASVAMGENAMQYVTEHVAERLDGEIGVSRGTYLLGALFRNIGCLFPLEYGAAGVLIGIGLLLAVCYLVFVYRKDRPDKNLILFLGLLGAVPYLRFIVLHNHSYLHYFFTYRAQIATVLACVLIVDEMIDRKLLSKGGRRSGK